MDNLATMVVGGAPNEAPAEELYDEEVLSAGWVPLFSILSESATPRHDGHVDLFADLVGGDLEAFLKKVYEHQR